MTLAISLSAMAIWITGVVPSCSTPHLRHSEMMRHTRCITYSVIQILEIVNSHNLPAPPCLAWPGLAEMAPADHPAWPGLALISLS